MRYEDNIEVGFVEIDCNDGRCTELAEGCVQLQALVVAALNHLVLLPVALTWYDVLRVYVHELIPVSSGLLMEDAQCMQQFVDWAALTP